MSPKFWKILGYESNEKKHLCSQWKEIIFEEDLKEALNSGRVAGAAVDVVSSEPIKENNPLLKAKNCIITPHIAWAPKESRVRLLDTVVDNLKAYLDGNPKNVVN